MNEHKNQPMVIVVYMDRMTMYNQEAMEIITKNIKGAFDAKNANTVTLFVPTDEQERIECINPAIVTEEQMEKINQMIDDISKTYDIGHDLKKELDD
jgi:hypothetical protein